jgi:hypothetical protein
MFKNKKHLFTTKLYLSLMQIPTQQNYLGLPKDEEERRL